MDGWKESLSEDLQGSEMVKNAQSLESIVSNAVGLEKKLGRSLTVPGMDATPEEHQLYLEKVLKTTDKLSTIDNHDDILTKWGKPEDKADYKGDPDKEYSFDMDALRNEAAELGLTQDQFFNMVNGRQSALDTMNETNTNNLTADRQAVFEEWGASKADKLDNIEAYMELMGASESAKAALRENMSGADMKFFARASESIKGETIQAAKDKSNGATKYTPNEANEAISKLMASDAYRDSMHANHKQTLNRYYQLIDMSKGNQPKEYYL